MSLVLAEDNEPCIEASFAGGGVLFRCSLTEANSFATAIAQVAQGGKSIMKTVQGLVVNNTMSLIAQTQSENGNTEVIELVNAFGTVQLDLAIRALQDPTARLSKPATIPVNQVEELLMQAFNGRKLIKSKINSSLAQANVRIPMDVLQEALDSLVKQEKAQRQERESKKSGRKYTLYGFGDVTLAAPALLTLRLDDLLRQFEGSDFELAEFLQKAEENKIPREQAQSWFDVQKTEGSVYEFAPKRFRRVL
ncbi:MAG: hypothetical protein ACE5OZ_17215 [Candidatus Heimdallarchaeota archaeon]